jgi:hypothetical protein
VSWIRRYVLYHGRRHPRELGHEHVREFLSVLAVKDRVAASTQNQALAALTFLYERVLGVSLAGVEGIVPARRAQHVPVVLSQRELRSVLARLTRSDSARGSCMAAACGSSSASRSV